MSAVESSFDLYRVTLSDVPLPGDWARSARCREVPPVLFFPGRGEDAGPAKTVCRQCAVIAECRAYALAHPELQGVWGGLSAGGRRDLRRHLAAVPEPSRSGRNPAGTCYRLLEQLSAHPERWARVARFVSIHSAFAMASQLRTGRIPVPPGRWRFEGRVNDAGGSDLYACFDGGAS